jgi:hypothetical protein
MTIFGREPAVILGLVAAVVQLVSATAFPLTPDQQGVINAVAVALAGVITAFAVSTDAGFAAVAGLVKAVIALALAFGLDLSPDLQSAIMVVVTAIGAFFVRTQVSAKVPARR